MLKVATLLDFWRWGRKDKPIISASWYQVTIKKINFCTCHFCCVKIEVLLWTHWLIPTWHLQCRRRHQPSKGCSQSPHSRRPPAWLVWPRPRHRDWSGSHPDAGLAQIRNSDKKICEATLGWWQACFLFLCVAKWPEQGWVGNYQHRRDIVYT